MAEKKYIGITIGPIFETINLSSSPSALWSGSYLFSYIASTLCRLLTEDGISEENIISPFYSKNDVLLNKNDGVGLFHDRIIFRAENYDIKSLKNIKGKAIKEASAAFSIDEKYLQQYVMISAAEFKAENPISESGAILDSLELAKSFVPSDESNPILSLFSENKKIDEIPITKNLKKWQLKNRKGVRKKLEDIVRTKPNSNYKKHNYYAIVRSDGDNMSKIIESLKDDSEIRNFSKTCLQYCSDIAEAVKQFGGVTIYSGGDDLLAILPCENSSGDTIFDFIKSANTIFYEAFKDYQKPTSLSFGITIAYYKFPLYEALQNSADLLFGCAKDKSNKNGIALHLQKHSGQSEGLFIPNDFLDKIIEQKNIILTQSDDVVVSALHKVNMFEDMFNQAADIDTVFNLFKNVFDAASHTDNEFLHKKLPQFFVDIQNCSKLKCLNDDKTSSNSIKFSYILRILKFFIEKGEKK